MASIWKTLEKHLINVEKPARYIGLEQGVQYPEHDESKVAWLLTYPDTYEVAVQQDGSLRELFSVYINKLIYC